MSDLISRQEVSDIIKTRLYQTALNNTECITSYAKVCEDIAENRIDTWINEAKSVEPERNVDLTDKEIPIEEYTDCVRRKDVLWITKETGALETQSRVVKLPSVEPEGRKGKWIVYEDCEGKTRTCTCNLCGYETGEYTWENPNYCENCGAKMEVDNG